MILLEEKCAYKVSHKEKVMLDPESQKVAPAAMVRAPAPACLAHMAMCAGTFDPGEI